MNYCHRGWVLLLACLLSACVPLRPAPIAHQAATAEQWEIQGKVAIRTADRGETASLYWLQQQAHFQIQLFGPLGIGHVQLQGIPGRVILIASNGQQYQAGTPEAVLRQSVGWQMPVGNLVYWIRALPAPGIRAQQQFDAQRRLSELHQQGWRIIYQYAGSDILPHLLVLTRGNVSVRIAVTHWRFFN